MSQFRRLLDRGIEELKTELSETLGESEAEEIANFVADLGFPGLIGLLGTSSTAATPRSANELDEVAQHVASELAGRNVSADEVRRLLFHTLLRGSPPDDVVADRELRDEILVKSVDRLAAKAGMSVTPEQAREVARLLATGEFFRDVGEATAAVIFGVRGLPLALRSDMRGPNRISRVLVAMVRDLGGGLFDIPKLFKDLSDNGKLDDSPAVLSRTLGVLYSFATIGSTAEMIQELIKPEHESVRLAIVIYARANGIPIEDADLDIVRETLFDRDHPDLGPALGRAIGRLATDRNLGEIKQLLSRMSKNKP